MVEENCLMRSNSFLLLEPTFLLLQSLLHCFHCLIRLKIERLLSTGEGFDDYLHCTNKNDLSRKLCCDSSVRDSMSSNNFFIGRELFDSPKEYGNLFFHFISILKIEISFDNRKIRSIKSGIINPQLLRN